MPSDPSTKAVAGVASSKQVPSYMLTTETRSKQSELVQQETIRRQQEKETQRKFELEAAAVRLSVVVSGIEAAALVFYLLM